MWIIRFYIWCGKFMPDLYDSRLLAGFLIFPLILRFYIQLQYSIIRFWSFIAYNSQIYPSYSSVITICNNERRERRYFALACLLFCSSIFRFYIHFQSSIALFWLLWRVRFSTWYGKFMLGLFDSRFLARLLIYPSIPRFYGPQLYVCTS